MKPYVQVPVVYASEFDAVVGTLDVEGCAAEPGHASDGSAHQESFWCKAMARGKREVCLPAKVAVEMVWFICR